MPSHESTRHSCELLRLHSSCDHCWGDLQPCFPVQCCHVPYPTKRVGGETQVGELAFTQGEKAFYEEVLRDGLEARRALTEHEVDPDGARLAVEEERNPADGNKPRRACLALVSVIKGHIGLTSLCLMARFKVAFIPPPI